MSAAKSTNFYTIFWHGERFYASTDVDAELRRASRELEYVTSQLVDARSNIETIQNLYNNNPNTNNSSDYWTAIANNGTAALHEYSDPQQSYIYYIEPKSDTAAPAQADSSSPRSSCGSSSSNNRSYGRGGGAAGGTRGRTIGKRNQEFYIPHGVLLSHTVHADNDCGDDDANSTVRREWIGRYDGPSNTIIRVIDVDADADKTGADIVYETLKHFAQEHDREMCKEIHKGVQEYRECNTPNVWTNPLFKFYNTVSLKWEPLSALRTDN